MFHVRECGDTSMNGITLQVYFGSGKGKTTAAIGQAIKEASKGRSVFIVQFLKGRQPEELSFVKRLEAAFEDLAVQEQEEEILNMKSGMCFAKKVLATGECDVLILDEILGLLEHGIVNLEDIHALLKEASEGTELIFTGIRLCPEIMEWADGVYQISALKE